MTNTVRNNISSEILSSLPSTAYKDRIVSEAIFGYRHVSPFLEKLPDGANILEIGSGSCLLLAQLAKDFPTLKFSGVEPIGPGFKFYEEFVATLQNSCVFHLHRCGYELLNTDQKFDVIFLVNVFQYLKDWRDFLLFVRSKLSNAGRCLILCPNYGFPYESIFRIPTLFNKRMTYWFFRNRIDGFEITHNRVGLWDVLNFVTWSEVRSFTRLHRMEVIFHFTILDDLINRSAEDAEFVSRQHWLSVLARFVKRSGLLSLLYHRIFWRIHPYMFLEITHPQNGVSA